MDDLSRCSHQQDGGADVVYVRDELDIFERRGAPARRRECLAQRSRVHLDLSGLTFADSTGAEALLRNHKSFETDGGRVVLIRARDQVLSVLTSLGLDQMLAIKA